jgi:hypothetical protein
MCRKRTAQTPRVYYYDYNDTMCYTVDTTDDEDYDRDHQEFVATYFSQGNTLDDFYRLCQTWEDYETHDVVECGIAEATDDAIRPFKAPPTTAVHHIPATTRNQHSSRQTRFKDTTMMVPTPKASNKYDDITIHHMIEEEPQHQCKRCPARFRKRNKLFAHLRTTNHYMEHDPDTATPNDAGQEHDPEVIKSTAPPTFGTGYGFRHYNYLEMQARLSKHGPDTWICLDTGAGMSLIDREWLKQMCPDALILTRASGVSVRGIDNKSQQTSSYVVLQLFIPGYDKDNGQIKLAEIRREFHIVQDLRCKMIVGEDIIEPEGFVIDSQDRKATIKSCNDFTFKLQITPKGRQVMHRRVKTLKRVTVPPGSKALVPFKAKPLPEDRDYEFTPVYDSHTAYLGNAGGFLRAVVDNHTDSVIFHNRSHETVIIQKDLNIGYFADFTADTYHACARFDSNKHPELLDAAENGVWKKGVMAAAVSFLACTTASRYIGSNSTTDLSPGIQALEQQGNAQAVFNPWHSNYDQRSTGVTENVGHELSLSDTVYQMTLDANSQQFELPYTTVDVNTDDEIRPQQTSELRALVKRYATLFEDRGTVAQEPEDDYMRITLKPDAELPNKGPYNNSAKDRAFIDDTFDKYHAQDKMGWAPQGVLAAWPAFVVWQKEKGRVVIDIRGLNGSVFKDPYPMPRQEDILQAIKGCTWISTLDLTAAFMQRALHKDSRHLVTVVTHRGLEYFKVAPFGFTNSPAHMQRFMDSRLRDIKPYVRCYVDDIVVHSRTFEEHIQHLSSVFQILQKAGLYLSPKKCHLGYHSVKLLGRLVDRLGLSTLKDRTDAIQQLAFPRTLQQLESFIGSANYNRSHIPYYAALIAPLEELKRTLLREAPKKGRHRKHFSAKYSLDTPTEKQLLSFQGVKDALTGPNTLTHFDTSVPLIIRMDASKERGYGAMITQIPTWSFSEKQKADTVLDPTAEDYDYKLEKPICFLSKRLNRHEQNYWPTELEVAGLVWTVRKIRHLVEDSEKVFVFTDHQATKDIAKQTNFRHSTPHRQNLRLVRASLYLSQFPQIQVFHIPGRLNIIPDALSRLQAIGDSTIEDASEEDIYDTLQIQANVLHVMRVLHAFEHCADTREYDGAYDALHLQTTMLRVSDDLIDRFQHAYAEDPFYKSKFAEMKRIYAKDMTLPVEYNNLILEDAEINSFTPPATDPVTVGSRRYLLYLRENDKLRLCIPRKLFTPFLQMAHDRNNHSGVERTYQKLRSNYFMKGATGIIKDYIQHCPACLINKPVNYTPSGKLIPITAPSSPWELVTMDFVVKLPPCSPSNGLWAKLTGKPDLPTYDSFLTITDKLTKYVVLVPGCESWSAEMWAQAYFDCVFPTFGVPAATISDRGSVFVSQFWTTIFSLMKTDCIATTAYNPRSDGQSERTNQVVEIALRHFVNEHQNDWANHLGQIQFSMNNSPNASTGKAPSELLMAYQPRSTIDIPTAHLPLTGKAREATTRANAIKMLRQEAQDSIKLAEFTMAAVYDKTHRITDIRPGDRVFINFAKRNKSGYVASGINSHKLGPQRVGPFLVTEMCGPNACRVDIPSEWKIWPVISIRHLIKAPATPDTFRRNYSGTSAAPVEPHHEVEEVLDMRILMGKKQYFVKYVGLPITRCEWVTPEAIEDAREKIEQFHEQSGAKTLKRKRNDKPDIARKAKKL